MFYHGEQHGLSVYNDNSFETRVGGNAIITFELCNNGDDNGTITVTDILYGSITSNNTINLKSTSDNKLVEYTYLGEPTILKFTINTASTSYLHAITVASASPELDKVATPVITLSKANPANREENVSFIIGAVGGVTFYYTLDGTTPTSGSMQYNGEVTLTAPDNDALTPITIKAIGVKAGMADSEVATATVTYAAKIEWATAIQDTTYEYDFRNNGGINVSDYTSTKIGTLWSENRLLKLNGNGTMSYNGTQHGINVFNGNSIEIKVAGNAIITFKLCQYGNTGYINVSGGDLASKFSRESIDLKGNSDGETATFVYSGAPAVLTFTITASGYLHGITVENTSEEVDLKTWAKKDFSIQIGGTSIDVTGAYSQSEKASLGMSGKVYYAFSESAYVSIDLDGAQLSTDIIEYDSNGPLSNVEVNGNNVIATFADDSTYPAQFVIRVQDTSAYVTPAAGDMYYFELKGNAIPREFISSSRINDYYKTDNGILEIGKGSGTSSPYWHDSSHGIAVYTGNYFDIKVAGDADIIFDVCKYGSGGTLEVTNLAPGGEGSFDSNVFGSATDGASITYSYTGDAAILRFTLTSSGESYLHKITVRNKEKFESSPVANEQISMPYEIDDKDTLNVTAVGHRLMVSHSDSQADITTMENIGYYVFDAREGVTTIEADVKILSVGSSSRNGVFLGMMEDTEDISMIATIGVRGDKRVRNIYSKTSNPSMPSAGSTDVLYDDGDIIHLVSKKDTTGWYTEVTVKSKTTSALIKYDQIAMIDDVGTSVKYGFAFANVNAVITNLVLKDENGNLLYDQKDAYEAVGSAPVVTAVNQPVLSSDRTTISVTWSGDVPEDDGVYVVELSTDGGETYSTLSESVTDKSYIAGVKVSGTYKFRVYGKCGSETTAKAESASLEVLKPLEDPVLMIDSGDSVLTLRWNSIEGATSYEIFRKSSEEEEYSLIAELTELTYVDEDVENETPYTYYVVAKSASNSGNGSKPVLSVPSVGRTGEYVHGDEAARIIITKKSYDTVYSDTATLEGIVKQSGRMKLMVNGVEQASIDLVARDTFDLQAQLEEGRNDVNLLFTDEKGLITRKTFNFVYLTNYDIIVDAEYTGVEGAVSTQYPGVKMFSRVQSAVDSVPMGNSDRVVILIKEGNYVEQLRVSSPYISLIGEDRDKVNISFYDPVLSPEGGSTNERCATHIKSTATGFSAENLTFENTYQYLGDGTKSNESADALRVDADYSTFVNVKMVGYQDTLYASTNHQYYYKCYILGNIDFIYGDAQALFVDSDIVFRYNSEKNSGYVTAPRTDESENYGFIFYNSRITAELGCSGSKYLLARPWGPDGAATFIKTYMSGIINTKMPYADMSGNLAANARFYEYFTYGEGFSINNNRPQISRNQAEEMLTTTYLGWDPYTEVVEISDSAYVGTIVTNENEKFVETQYVENEADPDSTDDTGLAKYSLSGYALTQKVSGGGLLLETAENYFKVSTAEEFLSALLAAKKGGKPSVIELIADIPLGSNEIGDALTKYSSIIKPANNQPLLHPTLLETGVSKLAINGMSNLTIFSQNGAKITHTTIEIKNSSNIIIRNLIFDEIWEWDEFTNGNYDRNDWDYIAIVEGSTGIWIDHCTFYKAYDGIIDIKKADSSDTMDVTISWSKFLPGSEGSFFDDMMDLLEANPQAYPYYYELMTEHSMTKEQIRKYSEAQKKTHLAGASDTEENIENLRLTLANNYYKDSMDRMPRVRSGYAHVYNTIMDASNIYKLKKSLIDEFAASKVVSNGAIATCGASVLIENSKLNGIIKALLSGNVSNDSSSSPGGYIDAINSLYYIDGVERELRVTDPVNEGLVLDVDKFKNELPYNNYHLYDADALDYVVLPYVGAGNVSMSIVQWKKTSYNSEFDSTAPVWSSGRLTASNITSNSVKLKWTGASDDIDVTTYKIYKNSVLLATVQHSVYAEYTVTGLLPNTQYTFKVEAGDAEWNWSTNGPSVRITTAKSAGGSSTDSKEGSKNSEGDLTDSEKLEIVIGNNGEVIIKTKPSLNSSDNIATSSIDLKSLNDAFIKAPEDKNGKKTVFIDLGQVQEDARLVTQLPSEILTSDSKRTIEISSSIGSITIPGNMFKADEVEKGAVVGISIKTTKPDSINTGISQGVMLDLNISVNGVNKQWKNTNAPIKLKIPFIPTEDELKQHEKITVIYLQENPYKEIPVTNAKFVFDEGSNNAGKVVFETIHNSRYAVKYVEKTFQDISSYGWAQKEIEVLASKGIIYGTSNTTYSPERRITRADFMQLLITTLGLRADVNENFSDVSESDYYYQAIGIAKKLGITDGVGDNKFNPKAEITREEMMTLTAKAMIEADKFALDGNTSELRKFTDWEEIAAYAQEYMAKMVAEGIVNGYDGKLNPKVYATRAEIAVIMYKIFNK